MTELLFNQLSNNTFWIALLKLPNTLKNFKSGKLMEVLRKNNTELTQVTLLDILLAKVQVPHFGQETNTYH